MRFNRTPILALLALLAALLSGATLVVTVADDGTTTVHVARPAPPKPTTVPGVPEPVQPDSDQEQSVAEQAEGANATAAPRAIGPDGHEDLRDETPPGVSPESAAAGLTDRDAQGKTAPQPVGGAQNYSVRNAPVVNFSSRNGQRVLLFCLHYTVSPNRPGWSDVFAIRDLFNRPSFGASSTYVGDFEGHFLRLMPETAKPWTQGNFNGRCVSIEIVATGAETPAQWQAAPLLAKGLLAGLVRDSMRRNGLPLRFVDPEGCGVQSAGLTDHDHLECGNDHHDVSPGFPMTFFLRQLTLGTSSTAALNDPSRYTLGVLTPSERRAATCLLFERRVQSKHGGWSKVAASHRRNAIGCKAALQRRNEELHRLGLTSRAQRSARHRVIHEVV